MSTFRGSGEWVEESGIEVLRVDVSQRGAAANEMALHEKEVGGGDVVLLVGVEALSDVVFAEALFGEELNDVVVDRDAIVSNDNTFRYWMHPPEPIEPGVGFNLFQIEPLLGFRVEDAPQELLAVGGDERGDRVLSGENFLVESGGILVFEGKIAANGGEEDDAAGPEVDQEALVMVASNHLGGGVARTAAGGFELLAWAVGVTEAEVDDFE